MAEEQQWARGYDGFTFRDPGTQLGSSGAQAAHGVTLRAHTERWHLPGAKHLANIMPQRDLHTPCGHTTETERLQATTSPLVSPGPTTPYQAAWRRDGAAGSSLAQKRVICSCWVCPNLCDRTPSRRQHQSKQGMRLERGKWQESRSQHHAGAAACCRAQRLLQGLSCIR